MVQNDPLWKGIIQDLAFPFLNFFFPDLAFDESKHPEFLDKELEQILHREDTDPKRRLVDKLIKVWTSDGEEHWFLIHVEVQGYRDSDLPKRMFQCFYRILDSYKMPVTSLVIFTDSDPGYKPHNYNYQLSETKLAFSFGTYKVLEQNEEELKGLDNPFALVILSALTSIKMYKVKDSDMVDMKIDLVRNLIERKYDHEFIRYLMNFIKFYVKLKDKDLNLIFEKRVEELVTNKNVPMGVEEIIIQQAEERGLEQGLERGLEQGLERGLEQGLERGLEQGLEQGVEQGIEQGLKIQLYTVIKKMIIKGKSDQEICDLLDVDEDLVMRIRKELNDD